MKIDELIDNLLPEQQPASSLIFFLEHRPAAAAAG